MGPMSPCSVILGGEGKRRLTRSSDSNRPENRWIFVCLILLVNVKLCQFDCLNCYPPGTDRVRLTMYRLNFWNRLSRIALAEDMGELEGRSAIACNLCWAVLVVPSSSVPKG
jgi:hypothetical protein